MGQNVRLHNSESTMNQRTPKTKAGSAAAGPWTAEERAAVIGLYLEMRADADYTERTGTKSHTKAGRIREAMQATTQPAGFKATPYTAELRNRSKGSIEAKLMNITAALEIIAADRIHSDADRAVAHRLSMKTRGYKPLANMQADLFSDVQRMITAGQRIAAE
jgi:hypothetical protein